MNLIFVGPQGSGKGTQAKKVAKKFGLRHISSGDMLREIHGKMREEVDQFMGKGKLVPDELIVKILKERLRRGDCKKGFILDGFPRNVNQAKKLNRIVNIDRVVEIFISDEEAVRRVCGRRTCGKCDAIYNINSVAPKVRGVCDKCGGELFIREDDSEKILRKRLKVYHKETEEILKIYDFVRVDGGRSVEKVFKDILKVLK